jgi:NAD(P)-dependent dehydrogenase (short-subunit alcohol dehydrogenase family)
MTAPSNRLDSSVALVTGGSRGIGRATALALARQGADVAVVAQRFAAAEATCRAVRDAGHRSVAFAADVANFSALNDMVNQVERELGPIDVLVNSAGVLGELATIAQMDPNDFARTQGVNLLGPLHGMRAVLPGMIARGRGVIVNLSSGAGQRPRPSRSMYGTSKVALDFLTTVAAAEAAPHGIRVYAVHPGLIDTDMNATDRARMAPEDRARAMARIAAGEMQAPDEPAACIAWLASPAGAAWTDVIVPWREPQVRARIRQLPGFPAPAGVASEGG